MTAPRWARWLVGQRNALLAGILVVFGAGLATLPGLRSEFAPEELVAPDGGADASATRREEAFGPAISPLVVLVEADDVLASATLARIAALSEVLASVEGVAAVDGPTTVPWPSVDSGDDDAELTLEDLEAASSDDDIAPAEGADSLPLLGPVAAVVATLPTLFPLGMMSFAESRGVALRFRPVDVDDPAAVEDFARSALVRRRLISEDRRVAAIAVELMNTGRDAEDETVRAVAARLVTFDRGPLANVELAGLPALRVEMVDALARDELRLVLLALAATIVVLALGLRSRAGILLPLGTVGVTVVVSLALMVLGGEPLNLLTNMIPPLLVTVGLAEAMHMVLRYREVLATQPDRDEAAAEVLATMWLPCFVTTFTTALGFFALLTQSTPTLQRFGAYAGVASMIAYFATIVLVPPQLPRFEERAVAGPRARDVLDVWVERMAAVASSRAWWIVGLAAVMFASLALVASRVAIDSRLMDQFADGSSMRRTSALLEAKLDGFRRFDVVLEGPPGFFRERAGMELLAALRASLREEDAVLRTTSGLELVERAFAVISGEAEAEGTRAWSDEARARALFEVVGLEPAGRRERSRWVDDVGSVARIEVAVRDVGALATLELASRIEERLPAGPARMRLVGEAIDASRGLDRITRSLGSLGVAIVTIFAVMTLLFRSVRLGMISIPPNALPLVATVAYMVARGIALHAATVIVFTVTLGLTVDGATHVIARYREELAHGGNDQEVLRRTIAGSGRGVLLSSITLVVGYLVLLTSSFEPVRLFGELSAIAIGGALLSQLTLLPALLALWGRPRHERDGVTSSEAKVVAENE